jgi:hypothetical protein
MLFYIIKGKKYKNSNAAFLPKSVRRKRDDLRQHYQMFSETANKLKGNLPFKPCNHYIFAQHGTG